MTKLYFIGTRQREITIDGPVTGTQYYLTPGEPLEVDQADADAFIQRDSHLWTKKNPVDQTVEVAALADVPAEAEPEVSAEPLTPRRSK